MGEEPVASSIPGEREPSETGGSQAGPQQGGDDRVRIFIKAKPPLSMAHVGQFIEELAYEAREICQSRADIPLVDIKKGSLELVIALSALGISITQFIFELRDRFIKGPVLPIFTIHISGHNRPIPNVQISGGGQQVDISAWELGHAPTIARSISSSIPIFHEQSFTYYLGTILFVGPVPYIMLEMISKGLIRIVDHREEPKRELQAGRHLLLGYIITEGAEGAVLHVKEARSRPSRQLGFM